LVAIYVKLIKLETNLWEIDMPFLISTAFFLWFVLRDRQVTTLEAILCLLGLVIFLAYSLGSDDGNKGEHPKASGKSYLLLILGGILVWAGATYTVVSIQELSRIMKIESGVIALSLVALGTSLPEVIVSMNAAKKGKTSIAVGNVLGSNVFN